ncbi:MAG: TIGR00341 family protein [Pseudomonadota bacterium]|nr:MAG: TIGR00341 family protein [Pseudomonadota bacterium]
MAKLLEGLKFKKFTPADLPELEDKLFFEGDSAQRHVGQFSLLLCLSAVIATPGIIADSTATVVGAMIIAPLMIPIVATTAALMMGHAQRAWRSILLVVAGTLGVIIVSAGLGSLGLHVIDFDTNSQITTRVVPRVLDLVIALAAGTAGAYAISRKEIADSIPGVAISIALVPPLCVVGISLAAGQWADAWGALLLFLTNLLSILLAGGAVFALLGLGAAVTSGMSHLKKRTAYQIIVLGVLLVAIPLTIATTRVARDSIAQARITTIVDQWMSQYPTGFVIKSVLVSGNTAKIIVSGTERPSTIEDLGAEIQSQIKQIAKVDLLYVPSSSYLYP